jgi:chaperonin GroES
VSKASIASVTEPSGEKTPIVMLHDRMLVAVGQHVRQIEVGDRVLFDPEDKAEVEVTGELYVVVRERDIHAVAADRLADSQTGLYL